MARRDSGSWELDGEGGEQRKLFGGSGEVELHESSLKAAGLSVLGEELVWSDLLVCSHVPVVMFKAAWA
eukprot:5128332-Pleurochrysis_carterae.AAC.4